MKLRARRTGAFGNGRREAGFVFGEFKLGKGQLLQDVISQLQGLLNHKDDKTPKGFKPADGVTIREIITAARSIGRTVDVLMDDDPNEDGKTDWRDTAVKALAIADAIKNLLAANGVERVAQLDNVEDPKELGLSEEQEKELLAAIEGLPK